MPLNHPLLIRLPSDSMDSPLATLRQNAPRLTPQQFVNANPGCHIQYFDDTPAKDPAKALSVRRFDPAFALRKQREHCAVTYSLQAFGARRTKDQLLCYRNFGVDIDLVPAAHRRPLPEVQSDRQKDAYLRDCLLAFPLQPHWLTETGSGFHAVFRIHPQRSPEGVRTAEALHRRLVRALRGDPYAALLTQLLRVPGTLQFKDPSRPFLCRLLLDNAPTIPPYSLAAVQAALDAWEARQAGPGAESTAAGTHATEPVWQQGLNGVGEGQRNVTATSLVGKILSRLSEDLWETAGWGGLKEWNRRNAVPLPERELRTVYESIARREHRCRASEGDSSRSQPPVSRHPASNAER
jgi:hypothetical protein